MRNASKAGLVLLAVAAAFLAGSLEFRRAAADTFGFGGGASSGTVAISNAVRVYVDGGTLPVSGTVGVSGYVATVAAMQDGGIDGVATAANQTATLNNQSAELSYLDGGTKNLATIATAVGKIAPATHCYQVTLADTDLARPCTSWYVGTGGNELAQYVADGVTDTAWHYNIPDGTMIPTTPTRLYLSADAGSPASNILCCY